MPDCVLVQPAVDLATAILYGDDRITDGDSGDASRRSGTLPRRRRSDDQASIARIHHLFISYHLQRIRWTGTRLSQSRSLMTVIVAPAIGAQQHRRGIVLAYLPPAFN